MDNATGKLVPTKEEPGDVDLSESETGSQENVTGKPVAYKTATGGPYASSKSDCQGSPKAEKTEWSHKLRVSPATVHHMEAVFSIVRGIYGREHDDPMNDLDVNVASRSPWILKASSRQVGSSRKPVATAYQSSNPDAASSSQGWQRDVNCS